MPPKKIIEDSESEDERVVHSAQSNDKYQTVTKKRSVLYESSSDEELGQESEIMTDSSSEHESDYESNDIDDDNEEDIESRFKKIERKVLEKACINKESMPNQLIVHTIELHQFKSYRDVCTVGPFSSDLNCIIGSNGSGKSNIIDAICFVFGFDSKDLRAKNLAQLVNNQTSNTTNDTYVKISFHLINRESREKLDWFDIERRIKSGELGASHYCITDNTGSRKASKKDVKQLLTKHGVDFDYPDRFIVLQHNTVKLVKQNPNEMMSYLEHLFGTDQIRDEMKKIDIEISDSSKQLENIDNEKQSILKDLEIIKPKVQQYEKFVSLKEKAEKLSSELEVAKWRYNSFKLKSFKLALGSAEKDLSKLQSDLNSNQSEKNKLAKKHLDLTKKLEDTEEAFDNLKHVIKSHQKSLAKKKATLASIARNVDEVSQNLKKLSDKIDKSKDEEEKISQQIQTAEKSIKSDQNQQEIVERERKALTEAISQDPKMQEYRHTLEQVQQLREMQDYQSLKLKEQKHFAAMQGIEAANHNISMSQHEAERIATEISSIEHQEEQLKNDLEKSQQIIEKLLAKHRELQIAKDQLCQQQMVCETSLRSINEHNEHYRFVRTVHELSKQPSSGCFGTLSDLYELKDEAYFDAVNSALCPLLKNTVVVESRDAALKIVNFFRQNKIGIVTCEILDEVSTSSRIERFIDESELIPMMDVISCDSPFRPLLFKHTNNWYITSNISTAKKYSRSDHKMNIVTLNGEIFKSFGEISSNAVNKYSSSLSETLIRSKSCSKLLDHTKDSSQTERLLKEIQNRMTDNANSIEQNRKDLEDEEALVRINNVQLYNFKEKKEQLHKDMDTLAKQISNYKLELSSYYEITSQTTLNAQEEQLLSTYRRNISTLEQMLDNYQTTSIVQHFSKLRQLEEERLSLQSNIGSNTQRIKQLKKKQNNFPQQISTLLKQKEVLENELSSLHSSTTEMNVEEEVESIAKLDQQKSITQKELRSINAKIVQVTSQQDELRSTIESMKTSIKQKEKFISELNESIKSLQSLVRKKPTGLKKCDDDIDVELEEKTIKKLELQLKFELEELAKITKDIDMDCMKKQKSFKKNMVAQTKRYNQTLKKIERASTLKAKLLHLRFEVFHQVCNRINNTLSQIYKDMGINNNCYISYCENKNIAFEKGVNIYCKPNGNEWIPFSKLSGGQMNLCCAIISLSMMKSFPTPICFFDEMDASLDSINVEMLSKIILEYSKNTQFICISFKFYEKAHHVIGVYHNNQTSCVVPFVVEGE